jgi:hypothetical protein
MILCPCQLRDGSSHQGTVTSMEPNEGTFVLHSETVKVYILTSFGQMIEQRSMPKCIMYIQIFSDHALSSI